MLILDDAILLENGSRLLLQSGDALLAEIQPVAAFGIKLEANGTWSWQNVGFEPYSLVGHMEAAKGQIIAGL